MRQWELIGITDAQPVWAPPRRQDKGQGIVELDKVLREVASSSVFFWTTAVAMVADAARDLMGSVRLRLPK